MSGANGKKGSWCTPAMLCKREFEMACSFPLSKADSNEHM
jgi:hypothetical protein